LGTAGQLFIKIPARVQAPVNFKKTTVPAVRCTHPIKIIILTKPNFRTMNKSQIRFAMAAHAAWLVMKNPVLTRIYMEQWEKLYPRPLSVEGEELTLYGYVFHVMYEAA